MVLVTALQTSVCLSGCTQGKRRPRPRPCWLGSRAAVTRTMGSTGAGVPPESAPPLPVGRRPRDVDGVPLANGGATSTALVPAEVRAGECGVYKFVGPGASDCILCGGHICLGCVATCNNCMADACGNCMIECSECETNACVGCCFFCEHCDLPYCDSCADPAFCDVCGPTACATCREGSRALEVRGCHAPG